MTSTDVVTTTPKGQPPIVVLRERLEARKGELKNALVDVTPDAFIRAIITSASLNPEILGCSWQSLWNACLRACRDGLLPDGQQGAIVPFKSNATWIPMYQGLLARFRRSGQFKWVTAGIVREGEEFNHYIDENGEHFYHKPGDNFGAQIIKIYALATTRDGGVFCTVLPLAEANKIRNLSRASRDDSPWKQFPEEMYKKTALRRLSKMLPSGRDFMDDDDPPDPEPSPLQVASPPVARLSGTTAALDQFAGNSRAAEVRRTQDDPAESQEPGPAQPTSAPTAGTELSETDDASPAPGDIPPNEQSRLDLAWARGRTDRAQGAQKRAMPGEYRAPDKTEEARAWQLGYEGKPLA